MLAYSSHRSHQNASFVGRYSPAGTVRLARPGTLEHWLTERYCLYTYSQNRLFRGEIHHLPWPLQPATGEIAENTIAALQRISLPNTTPLFHFSAQLDVLIWPLQAAPHLDLESGFNRAHYGNHFHAAVPKRDFSGSEGALIWTKRKDGFLVHRLPSLH